MVARRLDVGIAWPEKDRRSSGGRGIAEQVSREQRIVNKAGIEAYVDIARYAADNTKHIVVDQHLIDPLRRALARDEDIGAAVAARPGPDLVNRYDDLRSRAGRWSRATVEKNDPGGIPLNRVFGNSDRLEGCAVRGRQIHD